MKPPLRDPERCPWNSPRLLLHWPLAAGVHISQLSHPSQAHCRLSSCPVPARTSARGFSISGAVVLQ